MYQEIEDAVVARLKAKLDPSVTVTTTDELARVAEFRQKAPAVFLIYEGYTVGGQTANGRAVQLKLQFSTIVATKSAAGGGLNEQARKDASDLARAVLLALVGFSPRPGAYLEVFPAAGPQYEGGFAYLPISFTCPESFKADPA